MNLVVFLEKSWKLLDLWLWEMKKNFGGSVQICFAQLLVVSNIHLSIFIFLVWPCTCLERGPSWSIGMMTSIGAFKWRKHSSGVRAFGDPISSTKMRMSRGCFLSGTVRRGGWCLPAYRLALSFQFEFRPDLVYVISFSIFSYQYVSHNLLHFIVVWYNMPSVWIRFLIE